MVLNAYGKKYHIVKYFNHFGIKIYYQKNKNNYIAYDQWENLDIHRTDSYYVRNEAI